MLKKGAHDAPGLEGFPVLVLPIPVVHATVLHDSPAMRLHRHPLASYLHPTMQGLRQQEVRETVIGIHSKLPGSEISFPSVPSNCEACAMQCWWIGNAPRWQA